MTLFLAMVGTFIVTAVVAGIIIVQIVADAQIKAKTAKGDLDQMRRERNSLKLSLGIAQSRITGYMAKK